MPENKLNAKNARDAAAVLEQLEFESKALDDSPFAHFASYFLVNSKLEIFDCGRTAAALIGVTGHRFPSISDCSSLSKGDKRKLTQSIEDSFSSSRDEDERFLRIEVATREGRQPYCLTLEKRTRSADEREILCKLEPILTPDTHAGKRSTGALSSGIDLWSMKADEQVFEILGSPHGLNDREQVERTVSLEDWIAQIVEADAARFRESFQEMLDGRTPSFHLRYRTRSHGEEGRWISTIARRSHGEDGLPPMIVGLHKDESEIPHILDDLRLFSHLAKKVQLSILVTDPLGRTTWCNNAFTEITGYELDDMIGKTPGSLLQGPLSDQTTIDYMRHRIRRGKAFHAELVNYKKNGAPYCARIDANPLVDEEGNVTRYISFQTDITESKTTQSAMLRHEIKYRSLFDNSIDALLLVSPKDGIIIEANRAAMKFLDVERLVGQRLEEIFPESSVFRVDHLNEMVDEHATSRRESGEFVTANGDRHPVEVTVNRTPIGEAIALFVTLRDISEKRLLEEQLRHAQRMEAVGRLAGGIAHDFNNLLAGLRGFSELLCNSRDLSKKDHIYSHEILKITDRASKLTSRLLSFSRGKGDRPVVANLNEIVGNLIPMLSRILKKDIQFNSHLEPNLGNVKIDPTQLEQVVMNLVVNGQEAIASHDGVVTLSTKMVELTGSEIFITGKPKAGRYAHISVKDNGQGIPHDVLEKIFEPFFTTKKGAGTGLGLSIVYGIIQSNGGHLMVDSEVGKGTEFRLYFPQVHEPVEETESTDHSAQMPSAQVESGKTPTILVAEDQDQVREILELGLSQSGYNLLVAKDGAEAIKLGKEHEGVIDLVLTDSIMPKASGCSVSAELRELYPNIKVVMMSGLPQQESDDCRGFAVDAYVDKPFSIRKLLELIEALLGVPK